MSTQFAPNSMSLPPPRDLDLFDGARLVGWVRGPAIGFRGFANENEAAGAAWIAHRTLARRLAHRHGGPLSPIDVEPLGLAQDGDRMVTLAGGRPIATLVPPGADSLSGPDSFGFEIQVPPAAADELSMRSLAYRTYRTLRKSGARWAMWERRRVNRRRVAPRQQRVWVPTRRSEDGSPAPIVFVSKVVLAAIAVVLAIALIAAAPRTVTIPIGVALGGGLVATILVFAADRLAVRRSRMAESARSTNRQTERSLERMHPRREDPSEESMRRTGWLALGGVSIAVLLSAFFAPEELAVALATIGFVGLILLRLTAGLVGWVPPRGARPAVRAGRSDNGASGRPLQLLPSEESRNGTSSRLMSSYRAQVNPL